MSEFLSYHLLLRFYQAQNHLDRFQNLPYNTYGKRPFHPSVVFRLTCSNIVKPIMRESFVRCEPLRWIKVCQTSDNILGSESRGSIFHRTNGSRGFSLLKPPRNASAPGTKGCRQGALIAHRNFPGPQSTKSGVQEHWPALAHRREAPFHQHTRRRVLRQHIYTASQYQLLSIPRASLALVFFNLPRYQKRTCRRIC